MPDFTIPGNPGAIRSRAEVTTSKAQLFYDTGDGLSKIDASGWTGRAADHFRDAHDLEPDRWIKAGNGFARAGAALMVYADEVAAAQEVAAWAAGEHARGEQVTSSARTAYDTEVGQLRADFAAGLYSSIDITPFDDPGASIRANAVRELEAARAGLDNAAHVCAGEVRAGCADAPEEPNWLESGLKFVGGILEGAGEALWDLATLTPFSPINMINDAWKLATGDLTPEELMAKYELSLDTAKGMLDALREDPVGFGKELGKGLLDWDTWADDPARALGHLVPDAIAAALTAGSAGAATRGAGALDDIGDGLRAIDRMGDVGDLRHLDDLDNLDDLGDLGRLDGPGGLDDLAGLPQAEYDAIRAYTGNAYDELNAHLRGTDPTMQFRTPAELNQLADDVSSGLGRLPAHDGVTYRGTDLPASILDDLVPGGRYSDPAFSSTSESVDVAQGFRGQDGNTMFHIDGQTGHDITDISIFEKSEAEVLFDRGHEFEVVDKVWNAQGGYWDIYLRDG